MNSITISIPANVIIALSFAVGKKDLRERINGFNIQQSRIFALNSSLLMIYDLQQNSDLNEKTYILSAKSTELLVKVAKAVQKRTKNKTSMVEFKLSTYDYSVDKTQDPIFYPESEVEGFGKFTLDHLSQTPMFTQPIDINRVIKNPENCSGNAKGIFIHQIQLDNINNISKNLPKGEQNDYANSISFIFDGEGRSIVLTSNVCREFRGYVMPAIKI